MIKFFRKIRQKLLSENKFSQYLIYAIGEIILVVIGILIALQINNWNESNNLTKKELALLVNLKNDLNTDILQLTRQDSIYEKIGRETKMGLNLFYNAKNINDIESVSKLTTQLWDDLYINQNTYNEMINSGSLYSIKNKSLKKRIIKYYLDADSDKYYIREVSKEQSHLYVKTSEMNPYKLLVSQMNNPRINRNSIDTTWINNPKSPTYLAVSRYLERNQDYNINYRREVYSRNIIAAEKLVSKIDEELDERNQ